MLFENIKNVYFIGIGGIGMSALARWFMKHGFQVAGYDRTPSPLLEQLQNEGAEIMLQDDPTRIPPRFLKATKETLVVYTPAVPRKHAQLNYFQNLGFKVVKRAAVLGMISQSTPTIGVAGTHGKTTTSTLVAHLLKVGGLNSSAFLGGISSNYHSNLLLPERLDSESWVTVEADEYDRSFLQLYPEMAVITAIEPDHLDIYGTEAAVLEAFGQYILQIQQHGALFHHHRVHLPEHPEGLTVKSYGIDEGDLQAVNLRVENHAFVFDLKLPSMIIADFELLVPGTHNVENALAALAVGLQIGIPIEKLKEGIRTFEGVERRFDYHIRTEQRVFIDDYAHHPTELTAFLKSVKMLYPEKKLTVVFQPHLFTRTRDFADDFAESLSLADSVILLPIYPAREEPIEGVTSDWLLEKVNCPNKKLIAFEEVVAYISTLQPNCLATVGAGDIDRLIAPIKKVLSEN